MSLLAPNGEKLMDLTRAQRRVLDGCGRDDPAVVFAWDEDAVNIAATDLAANAPLPFFLTPLVPGANAAAWLKDAIATYASTLPGGAVQGRFGNVVIAPLTQQQYTAVISLIRDICYDAAMVAMYSRHGGLGPLAAIGFVADGKRPASAVAATIAPPPPFGCRVFA